MGQGGPRDPAGNILRAYGHAGYDAEKQGESRSRLRPGQGQDAGLLERKTQRPREEGGCGHGG